MLQVGKGGWFGEGVRGGEVRFCFAWRGVGERKDRRLLRWGGKWRLYRWVIK